MATSSHPIFRDPEYNRYSGCSSYWGPARETCTESQSSDPDENGAQTAEARAVLLALRHASRRKFSHVQCRTDSKFIVKALNKYILKWRQNGYRKCNGQKVKQRRIFEEIDELFQEMTVEVVWNPRNKNPGSKTADRLAKDAAAHHEYLCNREQEEESEYESDSDENDSDENDSDEDMDCSEDEDYSY